MNQRNIFAGVFTAIMLVLVFFLIWYIPSVSSRAFQLEDLQKSLETSYGRERKQQYEYDKVVAEIPEIQAELDLIKPQTEAAEQEVAALKAERKKLRNEKKELEKQLGESSAQEGSGDE
jgi:peptidoglycan hydrolase CwlO-like protein